MEVVLFLVCLWGALLVPLGALRNGWLPADDARRHAAFVVSGKELPEVVLLRPGAEADLHPGWHAYLRVLESLGIESTFGLVRASAFTTLALFLVPPLLLSRWREGWMATLCLLCVFEPGGLLRMALGRPFAVAVAVLVALGWLWRPLACEERVPWSRQALLILLFALVTWIHGSPYLWALPLLGFTIAGGRRVASRLAWALAAGVAVGSAVTGEPLSFLAKSFTQPIEALGGKIPQQLLATEFGPASGSPLVVALVLAYLWGSRCDMAPSLRFREQPFLLIAALAWALGFLVARFWTDWGLPALCVWAAQEIEAAIDRRPRRPTLRARMRWSVILATVLVLAATHDRARRWSRYLSPKLSEWTHPEFSEWLPDAGGILYNDSMGTFYDLFFCRPRGEWRYAVGFEPGLAPEQIRDEYVTIQTQRSAKAYQPWVERLRPEDRLALSVREVESLGFEGIEWKKLPDGPWVGRQRQPDV